MSGGPTEVAVGPPFKAFGVYTTDENGNISFNATTRELPTVSSSGRYFIPFAQQLKFQIRGVEVTIVVIVLLVWAAAIALFFNRWGKIRMLLPYQPDYKHDQLKVPGVPCPQGACTVQHSHQVTVYQSVEICVKFVVS